MGSSDPHQRIRQLAKLRAAYDASLAAPEKQADGTIAHSTALLGRILVVLGGLQDGAGAWHAADKAPSGV